MSENWQQLLDTWTQNLKDNKLQKIRATTDVFDCFTHCKKLKYITSQLWESLSKQKPYNKSLIQSEKFREKGNTFYKEKKFDKAIEYYTESIHYAPTLDNSGHLPRGYGNRSAALYHLKIYTKCLDDIELALSSGYPSETAYRLLQRRGQCLYNLNNMQHAEDAFRLALKRTKISRDLDIEKARNVIQCWIEKIDKTKQIVCGAIDNANGTGEDSTGSIDNANATGEDSTGSIDNANATGEDSTGSSIDHNAGSESDVSISLSTSSLESDPEISYGPNKLICHASEAVQMLYDEHQGRFLTAARDIEMGDTLIAERPFASVLLPKSYKTHCHHCHTPLDLVTVPCQECIDVRYCSKTCQVISWRRYHHIECPYLNILHSVGVAHLSLRIVLVAGLKNLLDFKKDVTEAPCPDNLSVHSYGSGYSEVFHLVTHFEDMDVTDIFQYAMTANLLLWILEEAEFFGLDPSPDDKDLIGGLLLRHTMQLVCNGYAITEVQSCNVYDIVMNEDQVRVATAIYPTVSLCNHSCDPNIISSFRNNVLVVKAEKNLKKGTEIYNCYGPHHKKMTRRERQLALLEQYFFTCTCSACTAHNSQEDIKQAFKCLKCDGPLSDIEPKSRKRVCFKCGKLLNIKPEEDREAEAENLYNHGVNLMDDGKISDATKTLRKCLVIRENVLYKYNIGLALVKDALARCYAMQEKFKESANFLKDTVKITQNIYGRHSVELAHELRKYAEVLVNAAEPHTAKEVVEQAMVIFEKHYGTGHKTMRDLLYLHVNLQQICGS